MSKLAQNLSTLIVNFIWKANLWLSNKQSTGSLASDISKESKKELMQISNKNDFMIKPFDFFHFILMHK